MDVHHHFIISRIDVGVGLPVEVIPGFTLKKPDSALIQKIKQKLRLFDAMGFANSAYEGEYIGEGERQYQIVPLHPDRWRYWVIESDGSNDISLLKLAAALLKNELLLPFTLITKPNGEGFSWHHGIMSNTFNRAKFFATRVPTFGDEDLQQLRQTYTLLVTGASACPKAVKAADRFFSLKSFPESSEFMVIGLFSVLESLITHAPELTEPMDSLNHQVKTKMSLLSKRFSQPLDYDFFFGSGDVSSIWGRLYEYRSKIAHGDDADFQKKLKLLRNPENATSFLKEAAKLLILCALREPQLISDLKQC